MMPSLKNGHLQSHPQTWLGAVDVGFLTEAERDAILDVLQRDDRIRKAEQERIGKLKTELRDVKMKGAKDANISYPARICARCNSKTGIIFNTPTQCPVCKHKVCHNCLVSGSHSQSPKCIVCYKETKLKAETGEWFLGLMRPELRSQQDGSTVVKQAVLSKPLHFGQRHAMSRTPEITRTPATSTSQSSSKQIGTSSVKSYATGSSTESCKQTSRKEGLGPAETGSIETLRKNNILNRTYSGEVGPIPKSPLQDRKSSTLPRTRPSGSQRPVRMADVTTLLLAHQKKKQAKDLEMSKTYNSNEEINPHPFLLLPKKKNFETVEPPLEDWTSDSSIESRSINGVFEDYLQKQKEAESNSGSSRTSNRQRCNRSVSSERSVYSDYRGDNRGFTEEEEDKISQLPEPGIMPLPQRRNEKLIQQNKFSASVPTVFQPVAKKRISGKMSKNGDVNGQGSMEFPMSMNRDISTSVPNLSRSNTSLNSIGMHDLTITGEVKFSLGYNYKANVLMVNIVECRNIATADRKRKRSDAYVKCYLLPDRKNKQKTDVKKRTVNPIFNKRLKFSVSHSELSTRILELSVWHAGTFSRNLFLGQVQVPLDSWNWDSKNENWFPLRQREALNADFLRGIIYKGDLVIGLRYVPPGSQAPGPYGELHILVKGAKNLAPLRSSGTVDAYVKILMQPDKQYRHKSAVISKTTSPEWNYNVRMQLKQPVEESGLQFTVCHKDRLQGSTVLGGCRINVGHDGGDAKWMDASGTEQSLWLSAVRSPNQWVDETIQLRPTV